jgi:glucose/arabinose dehydrogenase
VFLFFFFSSFIPIGFGADDNKKPVLVDPDLKIEPVVKGLKFPTTMAFLGPDDFLVLEKDNGTVQRISDGKILQKPLLDVSVSYADERGMLGISIAKDHTINSHQYVFLYYTKSQTNHDDDIANSTYKVSNYLYRYELVGDKLLNPKLLLSTPTTNQSYHNGGDMVIGPDNYVYLIIGDLTRFNITQAQNVRNGLFPDTTGGILRVDHEGKPVEGGIFGNKYPLNLYYAYGIRNGFGLDFDPVTGKLWETEDGPYYGDEINLVDKGFNGGWSKVEGIWKPTKNFTMGDIVLTPHDLVDFNGKGKYSPPELTWKNPACVATIKFLNSDKYGKEYKDDLFLGTSTGDLYHFDLTKNRGGLSLSGSLSDKVVDTDADERAGKILFGKGFGGIVDMQIGPYDGLLYLVSHTDGTIYKVVPKDIVNQ